MPPSSLLRLGLQPLQHDLGRGVGLLQIDAPVFQFFERDRHAGDRATHEGAGPGDAEIAIEVFDLGLAIHRRRAVVAIEHRLSPISSGGLVRKDSRSAAKTKPSNNRRFTRQTRFKNPTGLPGPPVPPPRGRSFAGVWAPSLGSGAAPGGPEPVPPA